jgi:hypothetical protein
MKAFLMVNSTQLKKQNVNPIVLDLEDFVGPAPSNPDPKYQPSLTPQIGYSNYSAIVFPARGNISIPMVFTVEYSPDPVVGLIKDPAFAEFINVCGVLGTKRPAEISYAAATSVERLSSLGYVPRVSGSLKINCPVTSEQISKFESTVKSKEQNPMDALTSVFGGKSDQ